MDPYKLAALQRTLAGTVAVADMERASKLTVSNEGQLAYKVAFTTDEDKVCVIIGELQGELTLCCQRCLKPFVYMAHCDFSVSPVKSDNEAKKLFSMYEAVLLQDGKVDIIELFEDELILALPQVPLHEVSECSVVIETKVDDGPQEMNQPFQVLQSLRKKKGQTAEDI